MRERSVLVRLLGEPAGHDDDGAGHVQLAPFQVDVGPPEGAQLAPAHAGQGGRA